MSQEVYPLLKHSFILQQIKVLKKKKKAGEMLFMGTVNKAFSPLQLYISQTFITKAESLAQTCTKPVQGIGCLPRYWWQLMKISTTSCFQRHKWKDTLKWIYSYYCCLQIKPRDTLPEHFQLFGYYCPWKSNHAVFHWGQLVLSDH